MKFDVGGAPLESFEGLAALALGGIRAALTVSGLLNANFDMFCGEVERLIADCMADHHNMTHLIDCEAQVLYEVVSTASDVVLPLDEFDGKDLYEKGKDAASELKHHGYAVPFLIPSALRDMDESFWNIRGAMQPMNQSWWQERELRHQVQSDWAAAARPANEGLTQEVHNQTQSAWARAARPLNEGQTHKLQEG